MTKTPLTPNQRMQILRYTIVAIVFLETIALLNGINGAALSTALTVLGGIFGFQARAWMKAK